MVALSRLSEGQPIIFGGNRVTQVSSELAAAFQPGDRLVVVQDSGALLHIPAAVSDQVTEAVSAAVNAFAELAEVSDEQITEFFGAFADRLDDETTFAAIQLANRGDIVRAQAMRRSTTRLELSASMRAAMIDGLRTWQHAKATRDAVQSSIVHEGWSIETRRSPLGVVGFVFEGRPNVFADAVGVVRTGNTVVFRIGSDALGTANAIVEHALHPALASSGLPPATVQLIDSPLHAAGWALFSNPQVGLAVARGSGSAVAQLGSVARQAGVAVSLHGTGGAWMLADAAADASRFALSVQHSLDRKVCNTLNVCCVVRERAADLVPVFVDAVRAAAADRDGHGRIHADRHALEHVDTAVRNERVTVHRVDGSHDEPFVSLIDRERLGHEWQWEGSPEVTLVVVDDLDEAIVLCNTHSPRFTVSLISDDHRAHDRVYRLVEAPFVGDGFTRWVDGQYALDAPELGLSNWEGGRMLARGAILSGDSVHSIRYRTTVTDPSTHR